MTASSSQPSTSQEIDSMKSITVLTALLALHGEGCSRVQEQGQQEGQRSFGRRPLGGARSPRPSCQGQPLLWESQGGEGLQGQRKRLEPVWVMDRMRGVQAPSELYTKDGMPWDPSEECPAGRRCEGHPRGSTREPRGLPVEPRDLLDRGRELSTSATGTRISLSRVPGAVLHRPSECRRGGGDGEAAEASPVFQLRVDGDLDPSDGKEDDFSGTGSLPATTEGRVFVGVRTVCPWPVLRCHPGYTVLSGSLQVRE